MKFYMKHGRHVTEDLLTIVVWGGILIGVIAVKIWFIGSLGVSAIKAISHACGTTYPIEKFILISGNWFCP